MINIKELMDEYEKYNMEVITKTFKLKKPKDFYGFIYELCILGIIDGEDYADMVDSECWTYAYNSSNNITFNIFFYGDEIFWSGTSMIFKPEHGEYKEIISNKELLEKKEYIIKELGIK